MKPKLRCAQCESMVYTLSKRARNNWVYVKVKCTECGFVDTVRLMKGNGPKGTSIVEMMG